MTALLPLPTLLFSPPHTQESQLQNSHFKTPRFAKRAFVATISPLAKGKIQEREPTEVKRKLFQQQEACNPLILVKERYIHLNTPAWKNTAWHSYTLGLGFSQELSTVNSVPPMGCEQTNPVPLEVLLSLPSPLRDAISNKCFRKNHLQNNICF